MATLNNAQFADSFAAEVKNLIDATITEEQFETSTKALYDQWEGPRGYLSNAVLAQRIVNLLARLDGVILGAGAPSDEETGAVGSFYFDTVGFAFYGPKTESGWGVVPSLPGVPWANIADKPTTLAGYGITDGRTAAQITSEISAVVDALIDSAPGALDTLNELAAALGDDPNFASTIASTLATKLNASVYTAADVRAKIAAAIDSNVFTDDDHSKLNALGDLGNQNADNVAITGGTAALDTLTVNAEPRATTFNLFRGDRAARAYNSIWSFSNGADFEFDTILSGNVSDGLYLGNIQNVALGIGRNNETDIKIDTDGDVIVTNGLKVEGGFVFLDDLDGSTSGTYENTFASGAAADEKRTRAVNAGSGWEMQFVNDASSSFSTAFKMTRKGTVPHIFFTGGGATIPPLPDTAPNGSIASPGVITDSREVSADYCGMKPDAEYYDACADIDVGTSVINLTGGHTWPADIAGKIVQVRGAGAQTSVAGGSTDNSTLVGIVETRNTATQVTLKTTGLPSGRGFSGTAGTGVTGARVQWMTDNTLAHAAALALLPAHGGRLTFRGAGYHMPITDLANKKHLEILGRGKTYLWTDNPNQAGATLHVQASCSHVGMSEIVMAAVGAVRQRENNRYQQIGARFDASRSELRSVGSFGNSNFGIFVGQDSTIITRIVRLLGGFAEDNIGDDWHFGHLEDFWCESLHGINAGDDVFGIIGFEAAPVPIRGGRISDCSGKGSDHRGLVIKHGEDIKVKSFSAKNCRGAGISVHAFRDADLDARGGGYVAGKSHYNDDIEIEASTVDKCGLDAGAGGVVLVHSNRLKVESLDVKDSGTTTTAEKANIVAFNCGHLTIKGGSNIMDRAGGGPGIYYHRGSEFEGRNDRANTSAFGNYVFDGIHFRLGVPDPENSFDILFMPISGTVVNTLTITNNVSISFRNDLPLVSIYYGPSRVQNAALVQNNHNYFGLGVKTNGEF